MNLEKKQKILSNHAEKYKSMDTERKSKGSVSQLMDDLDLINSVEQVEVMVNSTQTGAQNQKTSALVMLENLLGVFLICSTLFPKQIKFA